MSKRLVVLVCLIFVLSCISNNNTSISYATSCAENPEPIEALKTYDAVFSGRVIEIKTEKIQFPQAVENKTFVIFDIINIWQGVNQSQVMVVGMPDLLDFEKGKDYLVYAYTQKEDKHIWMKDDLVTSMCSRTIKLSKANYDLEQLGEGQKATLQVQLAKSNDVKVVVISSLLLLSIAFVLYRLMKRRNRI